MAKAATWRRTAMTAAVLVALTVGCSDAGNGGSGAAVDESADVTTAAEDGSTVGDVAVDAMSDATGSMCGTQRRTLEVAVEAHIAMTGSPPVSVDDMVGDLLREAPSEFDIGPDGAVRAIPGGRCA